MEPNLRTMAVAFFTLVLMASCSKDDEGLALSPNGATPEIENGRLNKDDVLIEVDSLQVRESHRFAD